MGVRGFISGMAISHRCLHMGGSPMSAGDRDTLTDTAGLLIDHQINLLNSRGVECLCGWYLASDPTDTYEGQVAERFYRQHLAEVIAARVRAAQAQAWDETCEAFAWAMKNEPTLAPVSWLAYVHKNNPYRSGDTEQP